MYRQKQTIWHFKMFHVHDSIATSCLSSGSYDGTKSLIYPGRLLAIPPEILLKFGDSILPTGPDKLESSSIGVRRYKHTLRQPTPWLSAVAH